MAKQFLIVLSILVITGCSTFELYQKDELSYVNALIDDHEYEVALRFIKQQDQTAPNYPQLQKKHPVILDKIKRYEQHILTQSNKLIEDGKWSDAIKLLEDAITHIPSSKKLTRKLSLQKNIRNTKLRKLRYQITLHEAQSIKRDQELYKRLYRLDSVTTVAPEIIQNRAKTISNNLLNWAKIYVDDKETIQARNSLKLAGEVVPEIRRSAEFRKLLRKIEAIEKDISKAIKRNRDIAQKRLIKEFNQQLEQEKFIEAQKTLKKIEERLGKTKQLKKLRKKLDSAVSLKIAGYMKRAKAFYSREEIEYAINEWGYVLLLDPNNPDALENISRAVKVLKQLQKVRKNREK